MNCCSNVSVFSVLKFLFFYGFQANNILPDEIIEDILSRIPVKTLLRFRCVCKAWCALISDPHFISKHLDRSESNSSYVVMEEPEDRFIRNSKAYILNIRSGYVGKHEYPSLVSMPDCAKFEVLSYCKGLICVWDENDKIHLWNPFTRKHKVLPQLNIRYFSTGDKHFRGVGLGYNPVTKEYEVVGIFLFHDSSPYITEVGLYSLGQNKWRRIAKVPCRIYYQNRGALFFDASLHWLASRENSPMFPQPNCVLSIDIVSKTCQIFDLPLYEWENESWATTYDCWSNISVLDGCLCVLRDYDYHSEVWVMKEYGVKESWVKLFTSTEHRFPICVTKKGEFVFQKDENRSLSLYDPKDQSLRRLARNRNQKKIHIGTTIAESLVQL